jgi:hypothetical protein
MRRGWLIPGHRVHHYFYWREYQALNHRAHAKGETDDGLLYHLIFKYLAGIFALFQTAVQGDK